MQQPLIIISKYNVTLRPELPDILIGYIRCCLKAMQAVRDDYMKVQPSQEDQRLAEAERKIAEAEALIAQLGPLKGHITHVYDRDFYSQANVVVRALAELGYQRIDQVYTVEVMVKNLMTMLKAENPYFSKEKFINYINNGGK